MRFKKLLGGLAAIVLTSTVGCEYQGGLGSKFLGIDQRLELPKDCKKVNSAGESTKLVKTKNGTTKKTVKYIDFVNAAGNHMLKEYTSWGLLEAEYVFVKGAKKEFYQGGIGSRFGGAAQELPLPEECKEVVNVGKTASTKYVVCKHGEDFFMKEYSDFGILEATYIFTKETDDGRRYQGGWVSRLGGKPQFLKLPEQCDQLQTAGKTDSTKYIHCTDKEGVHFLKEYSDWALLEAAYIFVKEKKEGVYQGGLISRFGGKSQTLEIPEECTEILNVGKDKSTKYVFCITDNGDYLLKEFSNWGLLEAKYRFQHQTDLQKGSSTDFVPSLEEGNTVGEGKPPCTTFCTR